VLGRLGELKAMGKERGVVQSTGQDFISTDAARQRVRASCSACGV
jgi:hypothetical protein